MYVRKWSIKGLKLLVETVSNGVAGVQAVALYCFKTNDVTGTDVQAVALHCFKTNNVTGTDVPRVVTETNY
jgi:hypothetical protein